MSNHHELPGADEKQEAYGGLADGLHALSEKRVDERFRHVSDLIGKVATPEGAGLAFLLKQQDPTLNADRISRTLKDRTADYNTWALEPSVVAGFLGRWQSEGTAAQQAHAELSARESRLQVAAAALLLDWGLRYPDISIQHFIRSKSNFAIQFNALLELATFPIDTLEDRALALTEIAGFIEVPSRTSTYFLALMPNGIPVRWIARQSVEWKNDRQYKVNHRRDPHARNPQQEIGPVMQLLHQFIDRLEPGDTFTHEDALNHVLTSIQEQNPRAGLESARRYVSLYLTSRTNRSLPHVERLENYGRTIQRSRVVLADNYRAPFTDLANIILAVYDEDPQTLQLGHMRARQLTTDSQAIAQLLQKNYEFSPQTKHVTQYTSATLKHILTDRRHPLTLKEIQTLYAQSEQPLIATSTLLKYLRALAEAGEIVVERGRRDPSISRTQNLYRAANDPQGKITDPDH